ncbi:hypothetical protein ACFE04_011339 [Oxalis oulophora]
MAITRSKAAVVKQENAKNPPPKKITKTKQPKIKKTNNPEQLPAIPTAETTAIPTAETSYEYIRKMRFQAAQQASAAGDYVTLAKIREEILADGIATREKAKAHYLRGKELAAEIREMYRKGMEKIGSRPAKMHELYCKGMEKIGNQARPNK